RGMPPAPQLARPANRTLRAAAAADLRLRCGVRLRGRLVERRELALEVALAAPERAHQPDRLVGRPAAALELYAHELERVPVAAHPDAEREAAAGELLQRRDLLRQMHRVVQRHEHDRRAETDPL